MRAEVWAPDAGAVALVREAGRTPLTRDPARPGWWTGPDLAHGERYGFSLDEGPPRPDPRSLRQPDGVHALSEAYDPGTLPWSDARWSGRELSASVLYELHVGTFTPAGTLDAAIDHLDDLAELGVDLVELMPLAAFDGAHGWGYDGVALRAVHEPYGGPAALQRFVDAAHGKGLGVVLDVVPNHLGPSGSYLREFGPYFTSTHTTPWGDAVNLDAAGSDEVRAFLSAVCLGWLTDFHLDGLRLDAVHALRDDRAQTWLEQLAAEVDALAARLGRPLALIAESDRNDPATVVPRSAGGLGLTAQWDDDFHHALHVELTAETAGYYADFADPDALATVMAGAFLHDGRWSSFRGHSHGRPVPREGPAAVDPWRFVVSLQTHDQVGNRAAGERLGQLTSLDRVAAGAALLLLGPFTPLLFMGEEWAASTPWQFFTSFPDPELGRAVSEGRRREFGSHGWGLEEVPDPQDPATRERSVLRWDERALSPHREMLAWWTELIALRRRLMTPPWATQTDERWDARLVRRPDRALELTRGAVTVVAAHPSATTSCPPQEPAALWGARTAPTQLAAGSTGVWLAAPHDEELR